MSWRILVADDEPSVSQIYQTALQRAGYNVAVAPSGQEAISILRNEPYDLLVLDLCMPEMDGFEVLRCLGRNPSRPKILMISGVMGEAVLGCAKILGADATVPKGIGLSEFLTVVGRILGIPQI